MTYPNNVLYSCCVEDPWFNVAVDLQKEQGMNPVYWIGWEELDVSKLEKTFPEVVFLPIEHAWRGNFGEELSSKYSFDIFDIPDYYFHESMAIKMMERLDPDHYSFNYDERKFHFRKLLRSWHSIVIEKKIDFIISPVVPHRIFDYALYVIAGYLNVEFLFFDFTCIPGMLLPKRSIYESHDYSRLKKADTENLSGVKRKQMEDYISSLKGSYDKAVPYYMKNQDKLKNRKTTIKGVLSKLNQIPTIFELTKNYTKPRGTKIEHFVITKWKGFLLKQKAKRYKRKLEIHYESLCEKINLSNESYIFIALHYQPEATTCPLGGRFVDQYEMINQLSSIAPKGWKILVKEHKTQFHPVYEGERGRESWFYERLLELPNVKLVSTEVSPFDLVDNALAVVTLTGTIGIESLLRGKPVILFGHAWYDQCPGVIRMESLKSLKEGLITLDNEDGLKVDTESVEDFLLTTAEVSTLAYHYSVYKKITALDECLTIKGLKDAIYHHLIG